MHKPPRQPLDELLKYAIVSASMTLVMLVLTRGKWFAALFIGCWLALIILRIKRTRK